MYLMILSCTFIQEPSAFPNAPRTMENLRPFLSMIHDAGRMSGMYEAQKINAVQLTASSETE